MEYNFFSYVQDDSVPSIRKAKMCTVSIRSEMPLQFLEHFDESLDNI